MLVGLDNEVNSILERFESNPNSITNADMQKMIQWMSFSFLLFISQLFISLPFTIFSLCSVGTYLYKNFMGNEVKFFSEFKKAFNSKIIIPIMVLWLGITLGAFLLFIPSIIILIFYIFTIYTYNIDTEESTTATAHSIEKGAFWRIIGTYILNFFIIAIPAWIYGTFVLNLFWNPELTVWLDPATRNYGMLILNAFINNFVNIVFTPLFICLLTPVFASQKAKKEMKGYYQRKAYEQPSYQQQRPSDSQSPYKAAENSPSGQKKSGMYCPYCGYYMSKPKKFCANCGENLEFEQ
jgi:hypothetical protein